MLPIYQPPWWQIYRNNKFKPRITLTGEMIIRKAFTRSCRKYLDNCSIPGVKHLLYPEFGWKERLFWIAIFIILITTLVYCMIFIWSALSIPLIVSMESTTYPISEIDFPGVALCNVNRISKKIVDALAILLFFKYREDKRFRSSFKTVEMIKTQMMQSGKFIDYEYERTSNFETYSLREYSMPLLGTDSVAKFMEWVAPNCSEMLMGCMWNGKEVSCDDIFQTELTSLGHCCIFNYAITFEGGLLVPKRPVKRQVISGKMNGLKVIMNPLLDDYGYPLSNRKGFDVFLFDPTHYLDLNSGRVVHRLIEPNKASILELQSRKQVATREVRKYSPKTRNCYFADEVEGYGDVYSMSTCITTCRVKTILALCKCIPFFIPVAFETNTCGISNVKCLNKYKEKLTYLYPINPSTTRGLELEMRDSLYCPECLSDCEHTSHYTKSFKVPFAQGRDSNLHFKKGILKNIDIVNTSLLLIYQGTSDGILDRLDVVLYWYELLSNFGGFAGMLLGFVFITGNEIIYYATIYFIRMIHKLRNQNK